MKIKIPKLITLTNPRWTEKMKERDSLDELSYSCIIKGKELDIRKFECCFVGETFNLFDKNYNDFKKEMEGKGFDDSNDSIEVEFHGGCSQCVVFSRDFMFAIVGIRASVEKLEILMKDYVSHLKKEHKKIVEKAFKKEKKRLAN